MDACRSMCKEKLTNWSTIKDTCESAWTNDQGSTYMEFYTESTGMHGNMCPDISTKSTGVHGGIYTEVTTENTALQGRRCAYDEYKILRPRWYIDNDTVRKV